MGKIKPKIFFYLMGLVVLVVSILSPLLINSPANALTQQEIDKIVSELPKTSDMYTWTTGVSIYNSRLKADFTNKDHGLDSEFPSYSLDGDPQCRVLDNAHIVRDDAFDTYLNEEKVIRSLGPVGSYKAVIYFHDNVNNEVKNKPSGELWVLKPKPNSGGVNGEECEFKKEPGGGDNVSPNVGDGASEYMYTDTYTITNNRGTSKGHKVTTGKGTSKTVGGWIDDEDLETYVLVDPNDKDFYTKIKDLHNIEKDRVVYADANASCTSFIVLDQAQITPHNPDPKPVSYSGEKFTYSGTDDGGCNFVGKRVVKIANSGLFKYSEVINPDTSQTWGGPGGSGKSSESVGCRSWTNPISWIVCPVVDIADTITKVYYGKLKSMLIIKDKEYGQEQGKVNSLKTAWSTIRILSTVALVGIALFVIISQMLGFEFLSAYTLKKMIPRIAIAIILIQLSWVLIITAIDIVNKLGNGLESLMLAPFGDINGIQDILGKVENVPGIKKAVGGGLLIGGVTAAFFTNGMGMGIFAVIIVVVIAVLLTFVILVLRKLLIIALLVIAPLAIIAWILPGTEKYWKMWWSNITKLLLMYPLIIGLISLGKIFASIAAEAGDGIISYLIVIIAYFGPLFLIPKTFAMSGSLMAMAGNGYNKISQRAKAADIGGFKRKADANKKWRADERRAKGLENMGQEGNRLRDRFKRTRGRWNADALGGYIPGGTDKILGIPIRSKIAATGGQRRQGQLRAAGTELATKNGKSETDAAIEGLDHKDVTGLVMREYLKAKEGDRVKILRYDKDTGLEVDTGRRLTKTSFVDQAMMDEMLQRKQQPQLDTMIQNMVTENDPAQREANNKTLARWKSASYSAIKQGDAKHVTPGASGIQDPRTGAGLIRADNMETVDAVLENFVGQAKWDPAKYKPGSAGSGYSHDQLAALTALQTLGTTPGGGARVAARLSNMLQTQAFTADQAASMGEIFGIAPEKMHKALAAKENARIVTTTTSGVFGVEVIS